MKLDPIIEQRYRKLLGETEDEDTRKMIEADMKARQHPFVPRANWLGQFVFLLIVFLFASTVLLGIIYMAGCTLRSVQAQSLIGPEHLEYRGAFHAPPWRPGNERFGYGMRSMTYNHANRSLFAGGHVHGDLVGEITIPTPTKEKPYQRALLVQPFGDVAGSFRARLKQRSLDSLGGLQVIDGKLYWSFFRYYAVQSLASLDDATFGRSSLDLSTPNAEGMWKAGPYGSGMYSQKRTSKYMLEIPKRWADLYVGGRRLGVGKGDGAGNSGNSHGPPLYAVAIPTTEPDKGVLEATVLIHYPPGRGFFAGWSPCDEWTGAVWIDGDRSAVLFSGRRGRGTVDYGTPQEVSDRQGRKTCTTGKGYHCDPYEAEILFYDPVDLAQSAQGEVEPHEIQPYASMILDLPDHHCSKTIGAMAYSPDSEELYLVQQNKENPIVHVWSVKQEGGTVPDPNGGDSVNTLMDTKLEVLATQMAIMLVEGASVDDLNVVVSLAKLKADEWKEGDKPSEDGE